MSSAASLVHAARIDAGLSIRGLADRAGVTPSTVSRIERGTMDPTLTMLRRVLAGASRTLRIEATDIGGAPSVARLALRALRSAEPFEVDWTMLRGLADWAQRHPDELAAALEVPPPRTGTALDAILASFAEELARTHAVEPPRWTAEVPPLEHRWEPKGTPRMLARARAATPKPFDDRNITLSRSTLFRDEWAA